MIFINTAHTAKAIKKEKTVYYNLHMMELFETINKRRSIRRFKDASVPHEDILKIIDAARKAPSAGNSQPWHFIIIKDKRITRRMADAVRTTTDGLIKRSKTKDVRKRLQAYKEFFYTFFEKAPVTIVVLTTSYESAVDKILKEMGISDEKLFSLRPLPGLQSVSAGIENMLLTVHALGYGACWMTGPLIAADKFKEILPIEEPWFPVALVPIGIPDESPPERQRKPIEEIITVIE
ncbi:MAG: nitroreductase family protein [Nitrospirota bacterium]